MVGDFDDDGDLDYGIKKKLNIPFNFPTFALNTLSVKAFNWLYYGKVRKLVSKQKVDIDTFFYPLDAIDNWNRIYGKNGFTQYQFILPIETSYIGLEEILKSISRLRERFLFGCIKACMERLMKITYHFQWRGIAWH